MQRKAARRKIKKGSGEAEDDAGDEPSGKMKFGEQITADHLITMDEGESSVDGDKVGLVILDRGTNWIDVFPLPTKEAATAAGCLQSFVGPSATVGQVYTDNSAELRSAVRQNGWCHATSTPGRPAPNGVAERAKRSVVEGARAALEHSGLHESWWSHAGKHFCFARNVAITNGDSSWNRWQRKGHFNGPC